MDCLTHVITQHLGPEELLVAAKVKFNAGMTVTELAEAINECEVRIRKAVPIAERIYLEPDLPVGADNEVTSPGS